MTLLTVSPAISPASFVAFLWESSKYAGTVIMASVIFSPNLSSASAFSFCSIMAEISAGFFHSSPIFTSTSPCWPSFISYGRRDLSFWISGSENLRPINLLTENMVFRGLVTACLFAVTPVYLSPFLPIATIDGVVRMPSLFSNIRGWPISTTAIALFVVPKSIPNILAMNMIAREHSEWLQSFHPLFQDSSERGGNFLLPIASLLDKNLFYYSYSYRPDNFTSHSVAGSDFFHFIPARFCFYDFMNGRFKLIAHLYPFHAVFFEKVLELLCYLLQPDAGNLF